MSRDLMHAMDIRSSSGRGGDIPTVEIAVENILNNPAEPGVHVVASPMQPMAVARQFADALYTSTQGLALRDFRGDFYSWDGTCWPDLEARDIRAAAYKWLEHARYVNNDGDQVPFAPTRKKIDDVVDALRAVVLIDSKMEMPCWTDLRTDPMAADVIAMSNGLLYIPTRRLMPHTPLFFSRHALPFPFMADARRRTRWITFLRQLWPDDESSIMALQEIMGYILAGDTRLQKIFLLVGPKRAGKGTIGRTLSGLLGAHNVAAPQLASLSTNFGLQPLIGKPLALISDARLSHKTDGQVVVERLL